MDTKKTRVEFLKKLNNSRNGNPRWRMSFDGLGTTDTPADVMWAYSITPQWEGKDVHVSFTKKRNGEMKLKHIELIDLEENNHKRSRKLRVDLGMNDQEKKKKWIWLGDEAKPEIVQMGGGFSIRSADFILADGTKMKGFVDICHMDGGELYGSCFYLPWSNDIVKQDDKSIVSKMRKKSEKEIFPYEYKYKGWKNVDDYHINKNTGWSQ